MEVIDALNSGASFEELEELLESGVDVNYGGSVFGRSALHNLGHLCEPYSDEQTVRILQLLIDHGADVNKQDEEGNTPLLVYIRPAILRADADYIECLLNNNADVNLENTYGENALFLCFNTFSEFPSDVRRVVKMILEKTSKTNVSACFHTLKAAISSTVDADFIRTMLKAGFDAKIACNKAGNVLHAFATSDGPFSSDRLALMRTFIDDYGVDINGLMHGETTPVQLAVSYQCDPRLVVAFWQNGASVFDPAIGPLLRRLLFTYGANPAHLDEIGVDGSAPAVVQPMRSEDSVDLLEFFLHCGCEVEDGRGVGDVSYQAYQFARYGIEYILFLEVLFMNGGYVSSVCAQKVSLLHRNSLRGRRKKPPSPATPVHALIRKYRPLYGDGLPQNAPGALQGPATPRRDDERGVSQVDSAFFDFTPELEKLKTEYVRDGLSLFQLCTENDRRKLGRLFAGCTVDLAKWKREFSGYFRFIEYKLEVAEKWHGALARVEALPVWRTTAPGGYEVWLPPDCVRCITDRLTDFELMALSTQDLAGLFCRTRCFDQWRQAEAKPPGRGRRKL